MSVARGGEEDDYDDDYSDGNDNNSSILLQSKCCDDVEQWIGQLASLPPSISSLPFSKTGFHDESDILHYFFSTTATTPSLIRTRDMQAKSTNTLTAQKSLPHSLNLKQFCPKLSELQHPPPSPKYHEWQQATPDEREMTQLQKNQRWQSSRENINKSIAGVIFSK